jgi:hypothetical protein
MPARYRFPKTLKPGGRLQPWVDALVDLDGRANKGPLIGLLESNTPIPRLARQYLADLLVRYNLKKKPNKPKTPLYEFPPRVAELLRANEQVRRLIRHGDEPAAAIRECARVFGFDERAVRQVYEGKDSSVRRMAKSRAHLMGSIRLKVPRD